MRWLLLLLCLATLGAAPLPERRSEMRSGDWYLLCDNWNTCRITGIATNRKGQRALVVIARSALPGSKYTALIGFPGTREVPKTLRLFSARSRWPPPPVRLEFELMGAPDTAFVPEHSVPRMLSFLSTTDRTVLRASGLHYADMPRGRIGGMLAEIERTQRLSPEIPDEDPSPIFDFEFLRVREPATHDLPPGVRHPCGRTTHRSVESWPLDSAVRIWIVQCTGRSRIFLQRRDAAPRLAGPADLAGGTKPGIAAFDPDTAILTLTMYRDGRPDCGSLRQWGWVGGEGFVAIAERSMPMCRGIPPEAWPERWFARRWRVLG